MTKHMLRYSFQATKLLEETEHKNRTSRTVEIKTQKACYFCGTRKKTPEHKCPSKDCNSDKSAKKFFPGSMYDRTDQSRRRRKKRRQRGSILTNATNTPKTKKRRRTLKGNGIGSKESEFVFQTGSSITIIPKSWLKLSKLKLLTKLGIKHQDANRNGRNLKN